MAEAGLDAGSAERALSAALSPRGFEVYPLQVGWYNALLAPALRLAHSDETLALVVLSTPTMFENAFLPFLQNERRSGNCDLIDQCVAHYISGAVAQCFPGQQVEISYDYEMLPNRRPRFLAQTAAHVAGATYYYQLSDVPDPPWDRKMFGVCIHPQFGGWFAIRALLVFPGVGAQELPQRAPPDCVPSREQRVELLESFNLRWRDWSYRDIVSPTQRYSPRQMDYFSTPPAQRLALLQEWGLLDQAPPPPATEDGQ
ncbi:MMAC protein, partial [Amia calva]|nr:MMAC protein [Amia calva]